MAKRTAPEREELSSVQFTRISAAQAAMLEQLRRSRSAESPGARVSTADVVRGLIEDAARKLRVVPRSRVG